MVFSEDPRLDRYILEPVIKAALTHGGKPRAKVIICSDDRQRGVDTIVNHHTVLELIDENRLFDVFILCVDRDCHPTRQAKLTALEKKVNDTIGPKRFIALAAFEELEVWVLAGLPDLNLPWKEVQEHCHPKEAYFEPAAIARKVVNSPGKGRKALATEAARAYSKRLRSLCPEIQRCEL